MTDLTTLIRAWVSLDPDNGVHVDRHDARGWRIRLDTCLPMHRHPSEFIDSSLAVATHQALTVMRRVRAEVKHDNQ